MKVKKCESEKTETTKPPLIVGKQVARKDLLPITWTAALSALRVSAGRSPSPGKLLLGAEGKTDIGRNNRAGNVDSRSP